MRIDIRNQAGLSLILELDQHLLLQQSAGWLQDDLLPGAFSYPVEFPLAPNEAFLQSGYRPEQARPVMELTVHVRMNGLLFRRCRLSYRVQAGKGSGFLKYDGGEVFSQLRKLTLQQAIPDVVSLGNSFTDSVASRMRTIASMPAGAYPFTFFPIRNEGFFEPELDKFKVPGFIRQPYVNAWKGGAFVTDTTTVTGYPVCPQFYLTWVLQRIFAGIGWSVAGDWIADPDVQTYTVFNLTAISGRQATALKPFPTLVRAGQHLPKLNVGDFLKALRQGLGLVLSFDSTRQMVTIRSFKNVVRSKAIDLTQYLVGEWGIEAPRSQGVVVVDAVDSADALYKDEAGNAIDPVRVSLPSATAGDPEPITLALSTTQQIYEAAPGGGYWQVPTVRQPGNIVDEVYSKSDRYPAAPGVGQTESQLKNDVAFRLLSYRGIRPATGGINYPLGTPDLRDGAQNVVASSALSLTGRQGRWRQQLRQLFHFRDQTRPLTVELDLPVPVLTALVLHEPIALALAGNARRSFLIETIKAQSPGSSGLMPTELSLLSIPDGLELSPDQDEVEVWLEFIANPAARQSPPVGQAYTNTRTYTVKVWADRAKSGPAVANNLAITVRQKRTNITGLYSDTRRDEYVESLRTYLINSTSTVIETAYVYESWSGVIDPLGEKPDGLMQSLQLDPGEGYLIL